MDKKIILLALCLIAVLAVVLYLGQQKEDRGEVCALDAKICPDGSYVARVAPDCNFAPCPGEEEGILISLPKYWPKINDKIKSPLKIKGEAKGFWFFEAEFTAELFDIDNNFLGEAILTAKSDWMTEDFVPFEGELIFSQPTAAFGILRFLSANPSGLPEHQRAYEAPVQFEEISYRNVLLYYYNSEKDKDELGNIKCSKDGLVGIEKEIAVTKTPIQDTIKLLLKGKDNLTKEEINQGIDTEYPLEGFVLVEANLKENGDLILRFDDPLNKTVGGSCRVGILWFQIEATAKQFLEVKNVQFLPEELFQP